MEEKVPMALKVAIAGDLSSYLPERYHTCKLVKHTKTAESYALYALKNQDMSLRPGLRYIKQGHAIDVSVWEIPLAEFTSFIMAIAAPLGLGNIQLSDGNWVKGFIFEDYALEHAKDISEYGSWQNYRESTMSNTCFQCVCIGEIRQ